ncbi:MAG: RnfH family protein [Gammaproteobacteria bacterium]|nr:RnfH family protein [Gammaproteobacteria bacterium]MDH4314561.1 RnfH family protein [Gammaproteobacteria bacterium]MDH5213754.1 RnfH family protein [Gammaproteobacteria bacterium]MDH5499617.1 RnfH family protein [Gammaproteobacteria bacterium]
MTSGALISIEIVFADATKQELLKLNVPVGTTVAEAISFSLLAELFPEQDFNKLPTGIWGKPVARQRRVAEGDRIELYRPLAIDPRQARRSLAAEGKSMGMPRRSR